MEIKNIDTSEEEKILDMTVDVWNEFYKLEKQHPSEHNDFADGIHTLQHILAMRMMRKYRPDRFPIKK